MTLAFNPAEISDEQTRALMELAGDGGVVEDFQRTTPGDGVAAVDIGSRAIAPASREDRAMGALTHGALGALASAGGVGLARELATEALSAGLKHNLRGTVRAAMRNPRGAARVASFLTNPNVTYGAAGLGGLAGAAHGALTADDREKEVVYGQMTHAKTSNVDATDLGIAAGLANVGLTTGYLAGKYGPQRTFDAVSDRLSKELLDPSYSVGTLGPVSGAINKVFRVSGPNKGLIHYTNDSPVVRKTVMRILDMSPETLRGKYAPHAAAAGAGLGLIGGAATHYLRNRGQEKTSMLPHMNNALATAAAVIEPTSGSEMVRTIQQVDAAEREARMQELVEEKTREKVILEAHKARQAEERASHEAMMMVLEDRNAAHRLHTDLSRMAREESSVEDSISKALGLTPLAGTGEDPDKEAAPMEGAGMAAKTSNVRQAALVGYQGGGNPFQEIYLEETDPTGRDRAERAMIAGGVGALAGGGLGYGVQRLGSNLRDNVKTLGLKVPLINASIPIKSTPRYGQAAQRLGARLASPRTAAAGTLLGLVGGALTGGLSNRGVTTGYNTTSGEELGFMDEREAQEIFDELAPGQQPGNFAVADAAMMPGLGVDAPDMAYAVDLDEAINEDPILQAALAKSSSAMEAVRFSYGVPFKRAAAQMGF